MKYQHGGDIYSQPVKLDYSANINPLGLAPSAREALLSGISGDVCSLYPDSCCRELTERLSAHHQVREQWIICGNGAAELIFHLAFFVTPRRGLVLAPTFSEYRQAMEAAGFLVDEYPLLSEDGFLVDGEGLAEKIRQAGREDGPYGLVWLCNPNNPTGRAIRQETVRKLAAACRDTGTLLAVDECFCEFMEDWQSFSVIPLLKEFDNLFVLKAFTKLYAMAGLRLGYGLSSNGTLLEGIRRLRQPWPVSGLAQAAGAAALGEETYVEETRRLITEERKWLEKGLKSLGFFVFPSQANYILFRDVEQRGGDGSERGWLYERLLEKGILIRSCFNYTGLDHSYYRICVKKRRENQAFLEELAEVLKER